ncbi:hypothetical protein LTR91_022697 [Friedmanniomyces endolithicus]|uniref:Cupin type-2 domain-containing protein n=1 Tax=Friedmanniomyces endolithicus TaxID=329885 RepID=A0AAN6JZ05_9PEZI|nr:hypothetical protein LTS09_014368 [Friedmanniomyces endolithicus]KAK0344142.1 hypothetical protein LTR94_015628 [Friedmanniomyces endolithicus]KAK0783377.1 hypothetical protein LTR38_013035 [Friedmanniomyces endolithicus]KAK0787027.1 hypothetical protein LTR59_010476 [Friedmanniomyces endolithicus]KAK0801256.1 hypothetical protein LTR75_008645 [Friedmanniomyces endolithicus]
MDFLARRLATKARFGHKTLQLQCTPPYYRTLTNATKPDYIPSLLAVPRVPAKPGNWHPTLVHSSGESKFTVIRLAPNGGEVPKHLHNAGWDYFMPLQGEAVIEVKTKEGVERDYEMKAGSFLSVGPGDVHRVRNLSYPRTLRPSSRESIVPLMTSVKKCSSCKS